MADELKLSLLISQSEKDGIRSFCYAPLPRKNMRRALRAKGLLEMFDGLLHEEILHDMLPEELRLLADENKTYWIRHPDEVDYRRIIRLTGPRRRLLPRALRLLGQMPLDEELKLEEDVDYPQQED